MGGDLSDLVVLVVEDHPEFRALMCEFVEACGATAREARDGYEAMAQVLRSPPHLIFCDLRMPGLDGFGLVERLREHPSLSRIPVIAVTGMASDEDVLRSWAAGFAGHLVKPVNRESIRAQMERARSGQPPA
jgi:two-component system chemotaxis sensor kinase CheA